MLAQQMQLANAMIPGTQLQPVVSQRYIACKKNTAESWVTDSINTRSMMKKGRGRAVVIAAWYKSQQTVDGQGRPSDSENVCKKEPKFLFKLFSN